MKTRVAVLVAVFAQLLLGCHADGASTCNSCDASPPGSGAGGAAITCASVGFTAFDKACTTAADCTIGSHQIDCCGSTRAFGISRGEQARFAADEAICSSQYPRCECPERAPLADDGQYAANGKLITVDCLSGMCMTAVE